MAETTVPTVTPRERSGTPPALTYPWEWEPFDEDSGDEDTRPSPLCRSAQ